MSITRLHPAHGTRSRVPRVPALRCIVGPRGAGEPERWAEPKNLTWQTRWKSFWMSRRRVMPG